VTNKEDTMDIKVLGPGCRNCRTLEQRTREALTALGRDDAIGKVTDFSQIAGYGVMATPALVIDGKVVAAGKIPTANRIADLLSA
jgi:small redox-active disulfide protein 2